MFRTTIATLSTALVFTSMTAHAQTQFEQLRERLLSGKPTISIVELDQCSTKSGNSKASVIGGVNIGAFQILSAPDVRISYADKHFTVMDDGTPVIEFLQYRVFPNDTATFKVIRLSPVTYKPLSEPKIFDCPLGTGLHFVPGKISLSKTPR